MLICNKAVNTVSVLRKKSTSLAESSTLLVFFFNSLGLSRLLLLMTVPSSRAYEKKLLATPEKKSRLSFVTLGRKERAVGTADCTRLPHPTMATKKYQPLFFCSCRLSNNGKSFVALVYRCKAPEVKSLHKTRLQCINPSSLSKDRDPFYRRDPIRLMANFFLLLLGCCQHLIFASPRKALISGGGGKEGRKGNLALRKLFAA